MAAGPGHFAKLRTGLADARCRRGNRVDDDAGAGRRRLCGRVGRRRDLRPLRHDRLFAGLCGLRAQPDPGARTRLFAGGGHNRGRRPALCGRSESGDRARRRDGARLRRGPCRGRDRPARLRNRPSVEADPLRLHERNRADCADQSDTQTARVQDHERRTSAGPVVNRRRGRGRKGQLGRVRARSRDSCGDFAGEERASAFPASFSR